MKIKHQNLKPRPSQVEGLLTLRLTLGYDTLGNTSKAFGRK